MPKDSQAFIHSQGARPDRFFGAIMLGRLAELIAKFQSAQEQGQALTVDEQTELEALIEAELRASAARAAAMTDALER